MAERPSASPVSAIDVAGVEQVDQDSRFAATTIQLSALIEWPTRRQRIEWQCTIELEADAQ